jgi:hypothetical protein
VKLRKIFGSKWTRKERTGGNRKMRSFFIFKLSKYNTDDNIKKEKKEQVINQGLEKRRGACMLSTESLKKKPNGSSFCGISTCDLNTVS